MRADIEAVRSAHAPKLWPSDEIKVLAHEAIGICIEMLKENPKIELLKERAGCVAEQWGRMEEKNREKNP